MSQQSRGSTGMTACGFLSLLKHSMLSGNCACANSVKCLPPSRVYWGKNKSSVWTNQWQKQQTVSSALLLLTISKLCKKLVLGFGIFFSFATKKLKEVSQSCTKQKHIFKFMLVVLTKTIDCDKKYFQKHKVCLWQRIECRQRLCFSSFRPR